MEHPVEGTQTARHYAAPRTSKLTWFPGACCSSSTFRPTHLFESRRMSSFFASISFQSRFACISLPKPAAVCTGGDELLGCLPNTIYRFAKSDGLVGLCRGKMSKISKDEIATAPPVLGSLLRPFGSIRTERGGNWIEKGTVSNNNNTQVYRSAPLRCHRWCEAVG